MQRTWFLTESDSDNWIYLDVVLSSASCTFELLFYLLYRNLTGLELAGTLAPEIGSLQRLKSLWVTFQLECIMYLKSLCSMTFDYFLFCLVYLQRTISMVKFPENLEVWLLWKCWIWAATIWMEWFQKNWQQCRYSDNCNSICALCFMFHSLVSIMVDFCISDHFMTTSSKKVSPL